MSYDVDIKSSDILKQASEKIKKKIEKDLQQIVKTLGKGAVNKAESLAHSKLSSGVSDIYKDNLYMEQVSDNIVVIGIRPPASWIENGLKPGFMEHLLKGKNVKTAKDGNKYKVIPFTHKTSKNKKAAPSGTDLVSELKSFLRSKGVGYSKNRALAKDKNGSPRIGRIHSFDVKDMKSKKSAKNLSRNLQGVSVFQNMNEKTGKVERQIMTFRVISEKHRGTKWMHPGKKAEKILEETHQWIQETWKKELLPALKNKYEGK